MKIANCLFAFLAISATAACQRDAVPSTQGAGAEVAAAAESRQPENPAPGQAIEAMPPVTANATGTDRVTCETPAGASACVNVVRFNDPAARLDGFNEAMASNQQSGTLTQCSAAIDIPAGTANGNHSYGGDCTLEQPSGTSSVRVCYDEMVGNFAIEPSEPNGDAIRELIDFTYGRCAAA